MVVDWPIVAVIVAVVPVVPGFITAATTANFQGFEDPTILERFYTYGFGFTFAVAFVLYFILMRPLAPRAEAAAPARAR